MILATYSIKGGVGKTSATVNLAYLSARAGYRTLLWDLDPQGAASFYYRIKPKVKGGSKALLRGKRSLDEAVKGTDFELLDLIPADFSYRNLDLLLAGTPKSDRGLGRLLEPLLVEYDRVFIDCPPSISRMSEDVFRLADALLVPVIPTTLSARTLDQLTEFLAERPHAARLRVLPFFSMADGDKALHTDMMLRLPERYPDMLTVPVPQSTEVERMGIHRMPLAAYAPSVDASVAYEQLWGEIMRRLQPSAGPQAQ
ncbi:MAG: ParA family protein [Thiohalocapsa sp.]|nr:ParA family protein [Thiohalocapsa sp.]MCF7992228.1 ParA family protein [Thiohalocapsa sp.]